MLKLIELNSLIGKTIDKAQAFERGDCLTSIALCLSDGTIVRIDPGVDPKSVWFWNVGEAKEIRE
jgi:hypothetical protein